MIEAAKRGLEDLCPDFEVLDENLELEREGRPADLVGVDADGRLTLVFVESSADEEPLIELVDALSFAHENHALLFGHFRDHRLSRERGPLALYVARNIPARLLARLQGLATDRIRLLELRALSSARGGERVYLIPVYPTSTRLALLPARDADAFLRRLPVEQRSLAHALVRRIFRIDDQLAFASQGDALTWTLDGAQLAVARIAGGQLVGFVPPDPTATALHEESDVEDFLGRVLTRCVVLLPSEVLLARAPHPAAKPESEGPPYRSVGPAPLGARGGVSSTAAPAAPPRHRAVSAGEPAQSGDCGLGLTAEELEAFRG